MSGSMVARVAAASVDASRAPSPPTASQPSHGAGSLRWQRARLVLDQHQRNTDVGIKPGQVLPVSAGLADLLPQHGLRRGSTVVVRGSTTLLLALLAEATANGSWAAVVGMPDLGLVAAAELGVAIQRLALIPTPGADTADVLAALLDGIDLVAVAHDTLPTRHTSGAATLPRRLSARARQRRSVLLTTGDWPGADLELTCTKTTWSGLGQGNGHLTTRESTITVHGRGTASRPTTHRLTLPTPPTTPIPLHRPPTHTRRTPTTSRPATPAISPRPNNFGVTATDQPTPAAATTISRPVLPAISLRPNDSDVAAADRPPADAASQPIAPAATATSRSVLLGIPLRPNESGVAATDRPTPAAPAAASEQPAASISRPALLAISLCPNESRAAAADQPTQAASPAARPVTTIRPDVSSPAPAVRPTPPNPATPAPLAILLQPNASNASNAATTAPDHTPIPTREVG